MVLESLLAAKTAEQRLLSDVVVAAVLTSVSFAVSYLFFPGFASMISIILISLTIMPLMMQVFRLEEERDEDQEHKYSLFNLHSGALRFFLVFFVTISLTVAVWQIFAPADVTAKLFEQQNGEITNIRVKIQGAFTGYTNAILMNNLQVVSATFLLTLIFGGGAAFILTWNASVFGVLLGQMIVKYGPQTAYVFSYALLEFLAYYAAGIAGGILSVGFVKRTKFIQFIIVDALVLLAAAVVLLVAGAYVENTFLG